MQVNRNDTAALRRFGWQMAIAWPLLFGLVLPWLFSAAWPLWPWIVAAAFASLALLLPGGLYWPARGWFVFAHVMGWLNTRLILALLFFVVITPLGWLLRLLGKLDYHAQPQANDSYWLKSSNIDADNMKDPF
ncbi:SxtJ family membrane protein [Rheinheimera maricola]|uniref:SxtJ family membrane protein n=1 Tax=Rheinheimera maricola TaxID=2793282 RepID=A0ABS7XE22_9GAMM|nr:SxtJ family membrane protein [Rheinheimera maricola]MBZ9613385.1 SxtJ family membrane protein [Rheinheimera maricola]